MEYQRHTLLNDMDVTQCDHHPISSTRDLLLDLDRRRLLLDRCHLLLDARNHGWVRHPRMDNRKEISILPAQQPHLLHQSPLVLLAATVLTVH